MVFHGVENLRLSPGEAPRALACSALTGEGVPEVWKLIDGFRSKMEDSGVLAKRRREQKRDLFPGLPSRSACPLPSSSDASS